MLNKAVVMILIVYLSVSKITKEVVMLSIVKKITLMEVLLQTVNMMDITFFPDQVVVHQPI